MFLTSYEKHPECVTYWDYNLFKFSCIGTEEYKMKLLHNSKVDGKVFDHSLRNSCVCYLARKYFIILKKT